MINILKFEISNNYKFSWNITSKTLFILFEHLESCMVIYRYKLSDGFDIPFIWQKFGTSDPNKIDFTKLKGKSLLLFHLEVYQKDPQKIRDLIEWCLENKIEIYIPISNEICDLNDKINSILLDYETNNYDFTSIKHNSHVEIKFKILEAMKPLIRDLKIKKLVG